MGLYRGPVLFSKCWLGLGFTACNIVYPSSSPIVANVVNAPKLSFLDVPVFWVLDDFGSQAVFVEGFSL